MAEMELVYKRGRLSYRKKSAGAERGREDFWLTRNRDGTRTMRCLAMTDDSKFVRDVTYTLGRDERPADVFIRLQVDGLLQGMGYFRVDGEQMQLRTDTADTGHTVQEVAVPPRFHVATHAVMLDGWVLWAYDRAKGGLQAVDIYNTSTRWNGTDGPLGRMELASVRLVAENEEITVPAGSFRTSHFQLKSETVKAPLSDVYVTGEHNILVRYDWNEFDLEYVLVELE